METMRIIAGVALFGLASLVTASWSEVASAASLGGAASEGSPSRGETTSGPRT